MWEDVIAGTGIKNKRIEYKEQLLGEILRTIGAISQSKEVKRIRVGSLCDKAYQDSEMLQRFYPHNDRSQYLARSHKPPISFSGFDFPHMLSELHNKGWIVYNPGHHVTLTEQGESHLKEIPPIQIESGIVLQTDHSRC